MNSENEIIKTILKNFRKSPLHKNEFFQSDSEIITLGGTDYLISVDSYSDEDHFRLNDPYTLGMNLAACTLSDIFACGGRPLFFCNSLTCVSSWSVDYIDNLSKGISYVLNKCGASFIGGDFGQSSNWNFTGVVIGQSERIVTRKGASPGDLLYTTGEIGKGNFEAASVLNKLGNVTHDLFKNNPVIFPVRLMESHLVSKYASSCIDTSDGLFKSLSIISEVNNSGFEISDPPYFLQGVEWTKSVGLPVECLMFGECGEYELLFTVHPENEEPLLKDALESECKLYRIGRITNDCSKILNNNNHSVILNGFNIYARDFTDHYQYINCLTQYLLSKKAGK